MMRFSLLIILLSMILVLGLGPVPCPWIANADWESSRYVWCDSVGGCYDSLEVASLLVSQETVSWGNCVITGTADVIWGNEGQFTGRPVTGTANDEGFVNLVIEVRDPGHPDNLKYELVANNILTPYVLNGHFGGIEDSVLTNPVTFTTIPDTTVGVRSTTWGTLKARYQDE